MGRQGSNKYGIEGKAEQQAKQIGMEYLRRRDHQIAMK